MPCHAIGGAIVCTGRRKLPRCSNCGGRAELLCDWKGGATKSCDRPICVRCTVRPAPGKDLCAEHAVAWEAWKAARAG